MSKLQSITYHDLIVTLRLEATKGAWLRRVVIHGHAAGARVNDCSHGRLEECARDSGNALSNHSTIYNHVLLKKCVSCLKGFHKVYECFG